MKYSISQIAEIIGAQATVLHEAEIRILLTDSRSLSEPAVSLFFALSTMHNDGHKYVRDLYERGVRNFVVQDFFFGAEEMPEANFLRVSDTLPALQQLATFHRKQFDIPIIAITGSNGKTIVKEWLYQLLPDKLEIVRSPRSYNSQTGVPLSVWQLNEQTELGIFEAGISLRGEMERLESIIRPTIGIFTTIGEAHQENFSSQEEKCLEKLQLFESAEKIIYNEDQSLATYCMEKKGFTGKTFAWSTQNPQAPLFISKIEKGIDRTIIHYEAKGEGQKAKDSCTLQIPFTDDASIEDAIHCLATILILSPFAIRLSPFSNLSDRFEKGERRRAKGERIRIVARQWMASSIDASSVNGICKVQESFAFCPSPFAS
jgi:alanine racemase